MTTTTKRNKGFSSVDLALPVAPYYRTDPQVLKDVETMRTNAASRWIKDDYTRTFSRFQTNYDNNTTSKTGTLSQPKLEILRANSPTLKRLLAARTKLERFSSTFTRANSTSRQSSRETPYPKTYHEKQSSAISQPPPPPPPPATVGKQNKSRTNPDDKPLDKITYEKTWSVNGNMKQKCSLEIWLPKPSLDTDDDDRTTNRTITPDINIIDKKSQPVVVIPTIKTRRSSIVKITATTVTNIETKSMDENQSKKSESIIIPRVYHYGDYIMDLPDERPRSSKSVTTIKSDSAGSIKSIRRQHTRPHTRRQSVSTHHSEEILRFSTIEVPTSVKPTTIIHTKTPTKLVNPTMINDLMQKYSLIKKNHQELTQTKLQLEKPLINDSKSISNLSKDQSPRSRPPPIPESTSLISPEHPPISVQKLLIDTSAIRSTTEQTNPTTKLLERRATPRKPSHSEIYPQLKIFSLANQRQHRQSSASVPASSLLPNVIEKKSDETNRLLQRSKTLDVVLDIPDSNKIKTRTDNTSQRLVHKTTDQSPSRFSKRSSLTFHTDKKSHASMIHSSGQHIHRTTTIPTNTVLIHFHHGKTERNYLVPE